MQVANDVLAGQSGLVRKAMSKGNLGPTIEFVPVSTAFLGFSVPPRIVKSLLLATLSSNARSLSRIQKSGNAATVRHGNVRKMRCGPGFLAPH